AANACRQHRCANGDHGPQGQRWPTSPPRTWRHRCRSVGEQRRGKVGGGREAIGREFLERAHNRVLDARRYCSALLREASWLLGENACNDRLHVWTRERRLTGEHLVGNGTERV